MRETSGEGFLFYDLVCGDVLRAVAFGSTNLSGTVRGTFW